MIAVGRDQLDDQGTRSSSSASPRSRSHRSADWARATRSRRTAPRPARRPARPRRPPTRRPSCPRPGGRRRSPSPKRACAAETPQSPRAQLAAKIGDALRALAGGSGHFADAKSGFSYATNFAMGPCGTCADDDDGGGDEEADDAQMREKMAKDMVLVMLCERASLPASFNEITAKMADVGWRRPPAQWQRSRASSTRVRRSPSRRTAEVTSTKCGSDCDVP